MASLVTYYLMPGSFPERRMSDFLCGKAHALVLKKTYTVQRRVLEPVGADEGCLRIGSPAGPYSMGLDKRKAGIYGGTALGNGLLEEECGFLCGCLCGVRAMACIFRVVRPKPGIHRLSVILVRCAASQQ